jgi:hypothetical protein
VVDGPTLALDTILENRVLFGSVNAHRSDWIAAVAALDRARERWPGALETFVGLRVPLRLESGSAAPNQVRYVMLTRCPVCAERTIASPTSDAR